MLSSLALDASSVSLFFWTHAPKACKVWTASNGVGGTKCSVIAKSNAPPSCRLMVVSRALTALLRSSVLRRISARQSDRWLKQALYSEVDFISSVRNSSKMLTSQFLSVINHGVDFSLRRTLFSQARMVTLLRSKGIAGKSEYYWSSIFLW